MLECVVNISEGRDAAVLARLEATCAPQLLDVHTDAHHNRSVFTLAGNDVTTAVRDLAETAVEQLDLSAHRGVHPRIGAVDVVPFVPLPDTAATMQDAIRERNGFARWIADVLHVPAFLYGPERTLPEVRHSAFDTLTPDFGPSAPHATAGATAVGARNVLVAYNFWMRDIDVDEARRIARAIRSEDIRALGLQVGPRVQVSCNLINPLRTGPADVYDAVAALTPVGGTELVGLIPASVLARQPANRWAELDLDATKTIEARVALL